MCLHVFVFLIFHSFCCFFLLLQIQPDYVTRPPAAEFFPK